MQATKTITRCLKDSIPAYLAHNWFTYKLWPIKVVVFKLTTCWLSLCFSLLRKRYLQALTSTAPKGLFLTAQVTTLHLITSLINYTVVLRPLCKIKKQNNITAEHKTQKVMTSTNTSTSFSRELPACPKTVNFTALTMFKNVANVVELFKIHRSKFLWSQKLSV